jgi:hypothetical protein
MLDEKETLQQDRKLEFTAFLDELEQRVADRAKKRHVPGICRVANVWRLNSAEATVTQDPSSNDFIVTFRCGPDASRSSQYKADTVDSTADAIIDRLYYLTR